MTDGVDPKPDARPRCRRTGIPRIRFVHVTPVPQTRYKALFMSPLGRHAGACAALVNAEAR